MINLIFTALIAVFMIAMLKALFETYAFLKRLEEAHTQLFEELGHPRWNIHFGDTHFRETVKKIRTHAFSSLGDAKLEQSYRAIRRADKTAWIAAAFAFLILLFQAIKAS